MVLLDTISSHYVCPLAFDDLLLVKTEKVSSFFFFFFEIEKVLLKLFT